MLLVMELLFILLLCMVLFMLYKNDHLLSKRLAPKATVEECWSGNERRRHVRFKKTLCITYSVRKKPRLKTNGRTADISEGGMKLIIDEKLAKGTVLDMNIPIPDSNAAAEAEGEVMWSEEAPEGPADSKRYFYTGIMFRAIKEPSGSALKSYIRSLQPASADKGSSHGNAAAPA